jgi:hypothetical protein
VFQNRLVTRGQLIHYKTHRNRKASFQAAVDGLVLDRLSDGHPLQRHLGAAITASAGFRLHRTAWLLCSKLRRSMLTPGRDPLAGLAEVGETEIACRSKNDPLVGDGEHSHQGKMLVVGAVEVADGGLGPGRIRLSEVSDYSAASLHAFLAAKLASSATAKTDDWSGYPGTVGVNDDPHIVGKIGAHIVLPWMHRIFCNLKVWALGAYHRLRCKHLQSYLEEFVFRFNRRRVRHGVFRSLLGTAAAGQPCSLQDVDLTGSKGIRLRSLYAEE